MNKTERPQKVEPASTRIEFTRREVVEALIDFVIKQGESIPPFNALNIYCNNDDSGSQNCEAVLTITHEVTE